MNLEEFKSKLPDTKKKVVSIFSGGLDSTILTYILVNKYGKDNVVALIYDYNQKHKIELDKAKITLEKLGIPFKRINISFLGDINKNFSSLASNSSINTPSIKDVLGLPQSTNYIANRNSILINIAVSFAETIDASHVFYGAQSHDELGFWDCSETFVNTLNETFKLNREHNIQVVAPFMNIWKDDEVRLGVELNVPFEDTWTCYNPSFENKPCMTCASCAERIAAFKKAGVRDDLYE